MLTISLRGIQLHAKVGMYPEEKISGNNFEIDVDVFVPAQADAFPFIDYTIIEQIVSEEFQKEGELLETFVKAIHSRVKEKFFEAEKVRVAVRKLSPPMKTEVSYAQVCFEN